MGNICRSPTAEGVVRKLLAESGPALGVELDSAGTHSYHIGHPPDRRAQTAAEEARARAEKEIADARRERETFAAESRAREQRERDKQ